MLTRNDELTPAQLEDIAQHVTIQLPGVPLLRVTSNTGQGFEALNELLQQQGAFGRKILDIDYDIYAAGEAELGWLNSSVRLTAAKAVALDQLLLDVVNGLQQSLQGAGAEVAHLKAIGLWEGFFGVANLVSSADQVALSFPSRCQVTEADLIVNARVSIDPAELQRLVEKCVQEVCAVRAANQSG